MQNVIEQEITINAGLERVWDLVTEPGWWVPAEQPAPADRTPGTVVERVSEKCGRFPVQVVELTPRSYAAFRWASQFPGEDLAQGQTTLIEFFVQEEPGSSVRVKVRESGFAELEAPQEVRESGFKANTEGWGMELGDLRKRAEAAAAGR